MYFRKDDGKLTKLFEDAIKKQHKNNLHRK